MLTLDEPAVVRRGNLKNMFLVLTEVNLSWFLRAPATGKPLARSTCRGVGDELFI
jgi:hypothetical protein